MLVPCPTGMLPLSSPPPQFIESLVLIYRLTTQHSPKWVQFRRLKSTESQRPNEKFSRQRKVTGHSSTTASIPEEDEQSIPEEDEQEGEEREGKELTADHTTMDAAENSEEATKGLGFNQMINFTIFFLPIH